MSHHNLSKIKKRLKSLTVLRFYKHYWVVFKRSFRELISQAATKNIPLNEKLILCLLMVLTISSVVIQIND